MAVPRHVDDAVERMRIAQERIAIAREKPSSVKSQAEWLEALTDFVTTLAEIQEYANESLVESLSDIGQRAGVTRPSAKRAARRSLRR